MSSASAVAPPRSGSRPARTVPERGQGHRGHRRPGRAGPVALRTDVRPAGCQHETVVDRASGPLPDSPPLRPARGPCRRRRIAGPGAPGCSSPRTGDRPSRGPAVRRGRRAQHQDVFRVDGGKTTGYAPGAVNTPLTCSDGASPQVRAGVGRPEFRRNRLPHGVSTGRTRVPPKPRPRYPRPHPEVKGFW